MSRVSDALVWRRGARRGVACRLSGTSTRRSSLLASHPAKATSRPCGMLRQILIMHDRANTLAFMHQLEGSVDVFERHRMSNEFVNFYVAVHVLIDHARKL